MNNKKKQPSPPAKKSAKSTSKYLTLLAAKKQYLDISSTLGRWKFINELESKISKENYRLFKKWSKAVEQFDSHRDTKRTREEYIKFVPRF